MGLPQGLTLQQQRAAVARNRFSVSVARSPTRERAVRSALR